jgi:hypothetical protein
MNTLVRWLSWMMNSRPTGWVLGLLLILAPLAVRGLHTRDYEPVLGAAAEAQDGESTSAASRLLGEVRTSLSDLMFLQTERYTHQGVAYIEGDEEARNHGGLVETVVVRPLEDWRGFIGDMERQVKPWMDPSKGHMPHAKAEEVLPWFRLLTMINPHRLRGYRIGTFLLMAEGTPEAYEQALKFAEEGITNNPDSHEMYFLKMRVLIHQKRLEEALVAARKVIELGRACRPADGWKPTHPGDKRPFEMEESLAAAMHMEVALLHRMGKDQPALEAARRHLRYLGHDPVLEDDVRELELSSREPGEIETDGSGG